MRSGVGYLAAAAAVAVVGASVARYEGAHPVIVTFFGVWLVVLPVVVFAYVGVVELCVRDRSVSGSGGGGAREVVELALGEHGARPANSSAPPDELAA